MPTLAIQDLDLGAKMAALAPSKCRLMQCLASLVRVHWVIRLRCARFRCLTLAILGRANMVELVYSAHWIITLVLAHLDSVVLNAKLSTIALFIPAKMVPNVHPYRILIDALAPLDSLAKPALLISTSVNAIRASTVVVSTHTDHTSQYSLIYFCRQPSVDLF